MKKSNSNFDELRKKYPETMSKDQFYQIAHISRRTALYLLSSKIIPCHDTGKKTRRYSIKTDDVIAYLIDREKHPLRYKASPGWYSGTAGDPNRKNQPPISYNDLTKAQRNRYQEIIEEELNEYPDVLSLEQLSEITGYSKKTLLEWIHKNMLFALFVSNRFLIPKVKAFDLMLSPEYNAVSVKSSKHICTLKESRVDSKHKK